MAPPWDIQKQKSFQLHHPTPDQGLCFWSPLGAPRPQTPSVPPTPKLICHYTTLCLSVVQSNITYSTYNTTNFCQWLLDNSMTNQLGDTPEWAGDHSGLGLTLIDPL